MKYSENPNYAQYMNLYAAGNLAGAKKALLACVADFANSGSSAQRADILQRIGGIDFELGDAESALRLYRESEAVDPDSLLAVFYFAKFLAEKVRDFAAAKAKCDEVISRATANPFPESEEDFASEEYVRMATKLRESL